MPVQVKICGLTRPEDIDAVNAAGADYAGFVFYEKSKRFIRFDTACELLRRLDPGITSVAVCVSPDAELLDRIEALGFDRIQIHGEIDEKLLDEIHTPVWQAVNLSGPDQLDTLLAHPRICGYLIDSARFGSGRTFGWETAETVGADRADEIRKRTGGRLFILAGGLRPDNVRAAIRIFKPDVVDVSSGVEPEAAQFGEGTEPGGGTEPGCGRESGGGSGSGGGAKPRGEASSPAQRSAGKDPEKISEFVNEVRRA